jgi:hypothetical protein
MSFFGLLKAPLLVFSSFGGGDFFGGEIEFINLRGVLDNPFKLMKYLSSKSVSYDIYLS